MEFTVNDAIIFAKRKFKLFTIESKFKEIDFRISYMDDDDGYFTACNFAKAAYYLKHFRERLDYDITDNAVKAYTDYVYGKFNNFNGKRIGPLTPAEFKIFDSWRVDFIDAQHTDDLVKNEEEKYKKFMAENDLNSYLDEVNNRIANKTTLLLNE